MPEITETLYVTKPATWRKWLGKNYDKKSEVWLIFPKAASGKPRISYNDAVEQALCFGWIDSVQKPFDAESTVQRFTPRKTKDNFSQPNIERLRHLTKTGQLLPAIRDQVKAEVEKDFVFPKDIMKIIQKNPAAYAYFQTTSPAYQRVRVAYVDDARSLPDEFKKRLDNFIRSLEKHKQLGFGGIEKYY